MVKKNSLSCRFIKLLSGIAQCLNTHNDDQYFCDYVKLCQDTLCVDTEITKCCTIRFSCGQEHLMMVKPKPFLHAALLIVVICEISLIMSLMPIDRSITEGRHIFIARQWIACLVLLRNEKAKYRRLDLYFYATNLVSVIQFLEP